MEVFTIKNFNKLKSIFFLITAFILTINSIMPSYSNSNSSSTPKKNESQIKELLFNTEQFKPFGESTSTFSTDKKVNEISGTYIGKTALKSLSVKISNINLILDEFTLEPNTDWSVTNPKLMVGINRITVSAIDAEGKEISESILLLNDNKDNAIGLNLDENDDDGDRLKNYKEIIYATDPKNPDTDGDGVNDYIELFINFTDPLVPDMDVEINNDRDGDGLTNEEELEYGTSLFFPDSDFDGINDFDEIQLGTDPRNPDTDGDGILDGMERNLKLNPSSKNNDISFNTKIEPPNQVSTDLVKAFIETNVSKENLIKGYISDSIYKLNNDLDLTEDIPGFLGKGVEVGSEGGVFNIKLTFEVDASLNKSPSFKPQIYYLNSSLKQLEEVENQTEDGSSVSVNLNRSGRYILLNKTEYERVKNESLDASIENSIRTFSGQRQKNIIIALDKDYDLRLTSGKAIPFILDRYIKEGYNIMITTIHIGGFVKLTEYTRDRDVLDNAIKSVSYFNTDLSNVGNRVFSSLWYMLNGDEKLYLDSIRKTEIVLVTGKQTIDSTMDIKANFSKNDPKYTDLINTAKQKNIPIHILEYKHFDGDHNKALHDLSIETGSGAHQIIPISINYQTLEDRVKAIANYIDQDILITSKW